MKIKFKRDSVRNNWLSMALSVYENEPCRICGIPLTKEDTQNAVFAGYSSDNSSRAAHESYWNKNISKRQWAFPEDSE